MKIPYSTIAIIILITATYFLISKGDMYIHPITKMRDYGSKMESKCTEWTNSTCLEYQITGINLLGICTYSFMHIGFKHLFLNMIMLLAIGGVVENKIGRKHILGIFIASSIIAGIGYPIVSFILKPPGSWVIGASAGIAGLLVAAYLVDLKKTIVVLTAALVFASFIALPLTDYAIEKITSTHEKTINETTENIIKLNTTILKIEQEIKEKQEKGENATQEIKEKQNITAQLNQTMTEKKTAEEEKQGIEEATKKESVTPASDIIHMFGALTAVLYMSIFKREAFEWFLDDLKGMWHFVKNLFTRKRRKKK